jgi:hypothetical protein
MNFRKNRPIRLRHRKAWCCIGFCFGLGVAQTGGTPYLIEFGENGLQVQQAAVSQPYLCVVGAPSLRFREPPPIPIPDEPKTAASKPTAGAPGSAKASPVPLATNQTVQPAASVTTEVHSAPVPTPDTGIPSVIPDEVRPRVRSEEFLPFFQPPGPAGTGSQPPESIPPSSATYEQK